VNYKVKYISEKSMAEISDLQNKISEKLEEGTFSGEDLEDYFQVFCEIGRNCDDFQEEIEDWNRTIVFDIDESGIYWISTKDGLIHSGTGKLEQVDLTLKLNIKNVLKIFSGDLDPGVAFMTGKLRLKGELPDALKFSELMEIVAEEIEYD
jgi:putative sterol carrier protein